MIKLIPINKDIEVKNSGHSVILSHKRQNEIEAFWKDINKDGLFHRGEIFNIESAVEEKYKYYISLNSTDYAHYLHTVKNAISDGESCKTIFGAGLIETADSKFIFGEMASHTAFPGRLQCTGGGLSQEDMDDDKFDIEKSVLRETNEELAIDRDKHIEQCKPVLTSEVHVHNYFAVLYHIKVNLSEKELRENYQRYVDELTNNNELPEFQTIISIENDKDAVYAFFENDDRAKDDYLEPFLKRMTK